MRGRTANTRGPFFPDGAADEILITFTTQMSVPIFVTAATASVAYRVPTGRDGDGWTHDGWQQAARARGSGGHACSRRCHPFGKRIASGQERGKRLFAIEFAEMALS